MSYNQEIYDRVIQHLADTRLYEVETQSNASKALQRHRMRLKDLLVKNIKSDVTGEINRAMQETHGIVENSIKEYSAASVTFHTNNLDKSVNRFYRTKKPSGIDVAREIIGPNIETSKSLKDHFNSIGQAELTRIQVRIGKGLAEGKPQADIIKEVTDTTKMTEAQVSALVRTSITRTQSTALTRVMDSNKDILDGYRFTAVLDSRTSAICSYHNGKVYPLADQRYKPPLHWNCRSSIVPVLLPKSKLREAQSDRILKKKLEEENESKLSGQAIATEDYSGWLRRQPMAIQTQHLGSEEKAALFQKGHLSVRDFITSKGNAISIAALRRLDNARTSVFPTRQAALSAAEDGSFVVTAAKPRDLMINPAQQNALRALYISDADSMNQSLSLVDFKGTSLQGKRVSRLRANNEFDERNQSFDPFTGEMKSTLLYDPDFAVYQERLDFLRNSKLLTVDQKEFIESFANSMEDKISVNQQSAIVENMRVLFERYSKDKKPWENFPNVARAELQYSVVNTSRILDRRSRERADLFGKYVSGEDPKVQIFGDYYNFDDLADNQLTNKQFVNDWRDGTGRDLARRLFYTGRAPLQSYFFTPELLVRENWELKTHTKRFKKSLEKYLKDSIPGYGLYEDWIVAMEKPPAKMLRNLRESVRSIIDMEFAHKAKQDIMFGLRIDGPEKAQDAIKVLSKAMTLVADGRSTDYDSLAINLGKQIAQEWKPLFGLHGGDLQSYHKDGSAMLKYLQDQKIIRVISRGKVRRAAIDIETGRPSGAWQETVSREVSILDPDLLELQKRNRQLEITSRIGVTSDKNRLYVVPGKKTYFDARGNDTKKSVVTRRASGNYDKILVDKDFADMLNHTMDVDYEVDRDFSSFMDEVVRFRDPRGNVKKYDDLNDFRKLILQRGDQGFGFMQTVKWHMNRAKPFKVIAQIDGRGRVYYEGYLTPTGGEVVRPFLNSAVPRQFGQVELAELKVQIGAMLGPSTEALTQAGRAAIFDRNEKDVLSLGQLLMNPTQRDRRIREFLEHPIIRSHDAEEIPKVTRLALEYARVHNHVGGDFGKLSKSTNKMVFGENHSDYLKTQSAVDDFNPSIVYHEFAEDAATIKWANQKGYTLKPLDLTYSQKESLAKKLGGQTEEFHRIRERHMKKVIDAASPASRSAFVMGNDHATDSKSVIFLDKTLAKTTASGKVIHGSSVKPYFSKLMIENDASSSGAQIIGLSTGDRSISINSNVLATDRKNRLYDLVAMDTASDPELQKIKALSGANITWEDLAKAAKA